MKATLSRLEVDLMRANKAKTACEGTIMETKMKLQAALDQVKDTEQRLQDAKGEHTKQQQQLNEDLKAKDDEKAATQGELDDLLMVFGDLEEKSEKYKVRCSALHCFLFLYFPKAPSSYDDANPICRLA